MTYKLQANLASKYDSQLASQSLTKISRKIVLQSLLLNCPSWLPNLAMHL